MRVCKHCKEKGNIDEMIVYEKETKRKKKDGTFSISRAFYHAHCDLKMKKEQKFKEQETKELDALYQYLLDLHNLKTLDGRMFERIQDLRNGTVKANNRKIKRYKEGVKYSLMLDSYKYIEKNIDYIMRSKHFEQKWNEFAYIFGAMVRSISEVESIKKKLKESEARAKVMSEDFKIDVSKVNSKKKDDDMDISEFL